MHLQVLSSGSEGNSALVRGGETALLVDAGLGKQAMEQRMAKAGLAVGLVAHVLVTHGHLDHARSAGAIARREQGTLHCPESIARHPAARRARSMATLKVDATFELCDKADRDPITVTSVALPHDCDPTVAFAFDQGGRRAVILTDMGRPDATVARRLAHAHVLVLEFNHDSDMLASGPYPQVLQRRIAGGRGHLSNTQSATMLEQLASAELHTLVLAHLSSKNNRVELALEAAHGTLQRLGLSHVRVLVARQDAALEALLV